MRLIAILSAVTVFMSCSSCGRTDINYPEFSTGVDFPDPPVEIMSNLDESSSEYDCRLINYFNIVQVKEDLFYMYYAAFGNNSGEADIDQGLFFAYSSDAIHWKRETPDGGSNLLLENGIQEQSVFKLDTDKEYPFRLIANIKEDGKFKLCMWRSKNGYVFDFSDKTVLLDDRLHDTQNVIVPRSTYLRLYTRLWNESATNRRNGVAKLTKDANRISSVDTLNGDFLYNSAASLINESTDLLLPTYMNNKSEEVKSDSAYFKAYLNFGSLCQEIDMNLNKWLKDDEKWRIAAPGIIKIKGHSYIAYYTWTWSHDSPQPVDGVSRYYLIRMNLYIDGKKIEI